MRRCCETAGRLIWKCPAIVLTERSAPTRRSSIRRRAGWLIAPKTSGLRSRVTTMLPIYVSKHLRVKSAVGLIVLDGPGPQSRRYESEIQKRDHYSTSRLFRVRMKIGGKLRFLSESCNAWTASCDSLVVVLAR